MRTRLWLQGCSKYEYKYRGVIHAVASILRKEGVPALYKGFSSVALFSPLANGLYFSAYEFAKQELECDAHGPLYFNLSPTCSPVVAATLATMLSSLLWTPMDVIKQNQQASVVRVYSGVFDGLRKVHLQGGMQRGLLKGYCSVSILHIFFRLHQ